MHVVQFEITKPTDDSAFEDMCARIYGEVFGDPLPKINGRRGQAQAGVDVFVNSPAGRVGIQCKRYVDGALTFKHVEAEVGRADKAKTPITRLIVATTSSSDARLIRQVQDLSDEREQQGKYPVEVEFWDDVCRHIRGSTRLQRDYAPNAPGAMFHRQEESNLFTHTALMRIESKLDFATGLPEGRSESVDKLISSQLDGVNELLKKCRFRDALSDLSRVGSNLTLFDAHQKARWYLQRGLCSWHLDGGESACSDFLKAAELYPNDEKMAAAGIRGLLLRDDITGALAAGEEVLERFPGSHHVWIAYANAKMLAGENLALTDVPISMRENCDVLQLLAWARKRMGDVTEAVKLSKKALESADAGFFVRRTALALALEAAAGDTASCAFGLIPDADLEMLDLAVAQLNPRTERLWSIQSADIDDTAVHLGYAYIVLGRANEALDLVDEARHLTLLSPRLMRVALDAYRKLDRIDELLAKGRLWLESLEEEALVLVAEVASNVGDTALVSAAATASQKVQLSEPETTNLFAAMRWLALWRSKEGRQLALDEVKAANLTDSESIALICGGARVLHFSGEEDECEAAVSRAIGLVSGDTSDSVLLLLADLLFAVGKYLQAAKYYERFLVRGRHSALHTQLLACYVKGGARRKARELLQSLPGDWTANDEARALALELGQQAADWDFLIPLAEVQCERSPKSAGAWLLRLFLDLKTKRMLRFHQSLAELPDELDGTQRQNAQLASLELQYDRKRSGMRRLYRVFRRSMDDLDAASAYFIGIVAASGQLPNMEENLCAVTEGSTVSLEDKFGSKVTVSIDPDDAAPVPARGGFYSSDNPDISALLGATLGSSVELPGPFGTERSYIVTGITSTYRQLLTVAQDKFRSSMSSSATIASVPVGQTEQGADFSQMHAMLKRQTEHLKEVFDAYVKSPLTLGILARLLGRNVIDLVSGWPRDGAPLFSCAGTQEERNEAEQLLKRDEACYVVDAATIAELVWLKCEAALKALPKVYCSTTTMSVLEARLEEAKSERSGGRVFDDGEQMRFIEFTEEDKARIIKYCQTMVDAVRTYCEVVPAYGPGALPAELVNASDVLEDEEYSALLLLAERGATLLTIDGRLARLAVVTCGGGALWPQVLLRYAAGMNQIRPLDYSLAVLDEFLANRTFVSLSAADLVLMCQQGGYALRTGLQKLKDYLANSSTDLASAWSVALEFLQLQATQPTQTKAFMELFGHVLEATLRHPSCDKRLLLEQASEFAEQIAWTAAGRYSPYPAVSAMRRARFELLMKGFEEVAVTATIFASEPCRRRAIKLRTLMCTNPPWLGYDERVQETLADSIGAYVPPPAEQTGCGNETSDSNCADNVTFVADDADASRSGLAAARGLVPEV